MQLRTDQEKGIHDLALLAGKGLRRLVFQLGTGGGKCLGKDTPVLMYDGSIKLVQDIAAGDKLMGPDSRPRNVLSTTTGREMLYKVVPVKGDSYIVNESHILSLKQTNGGVSHPNLGGGRMVNISVFDYNNKPKAFKHTHKGWRIGVDFPAHRHSLPIDPYFLGVWLGDGNSDGPGVTTLEPEIVDTINKFALANNLKVRKDACGGRCPTYYITTGIKRSRKSMLLNKLRELNLLLNKHIPHIYKTASRDDRLNLLAGIIDTDGYLNKGASFDCVFKRLQLANDVCYLARSLGLAAYVKECIKKCCNNGVIGVYYRISISGDCSVVPVKIKRKKASQRLQKKSALVTGIKVHKIGIGDYYGFEINGDGLFCLGDFTVTHNTAICANIIGRFTNKSSGMRVVVFVHREELVKQMRMALYNWCELSCEMIIPENKKPRNTQIYICMIETAHNRLKKNPRYFGDVGLTIVDECHRAEFRKIEEYFPKSIHVGLTATPISSSKKDPLKDHYDEIVCGPSIRDLISIGALCQNITYHAQTVNRKAIAMKGPDFDERQMGEEYSKLRHVENAVRGYRDHAEGRKAMVFNCTIEHSKLVAAAFVAAGYPCKHIDSEMCDKDAKLREETLRWFRETNGAILCNVALFGVGFDEPSVSCIIMNLSTVSVVKWMQATGRGSRPYPGKSDFVILDLGGNAINLGDWSDDRDWHAVFHHPPKPREKLQAPPVKDCPQCQAIVHAAATTCQFCGHKFPIADITYNDAEVKFELLIKNRPVVIDISDMIAENKHKEYAVLHKIKSKFIAQAKYKWGVIRGNCTDKIAERLIERYQSAAKDWCHLKGKKFNQWHQDRTREWMLQALRSSFEYIPHANVTKPNDFSLQESH